MSAFGSVRCPARGTRGEVVGSVQEARKHLRDKQVKFGAPKTDQVHKFKELDRGGGRGKVALVV